MSGRQEPKAFGCPLCFGEDPAAASNHDLKTRSKLIDESHFDVALRRCPACGQQFVQIFTEFVDWADGDDPQYWDLLPLTAQEADALATQGTAVDLKQIEELGRHRRRLKMDHPKGQPRRVKWATGGLSIYPGH